MNILILNPSYQVASVQMFRQIMTKMGHRVYTADFNYETAFSLEINQHTLLSVRPDKVSQLIDFCRRKSIDGIISFSPLDYNFLAYYQDHFQRIGSYPIVSKAQDLEITSSPRKLRKFLRKSNFNYIPYFIHLEDFLQAYLKQEITFPVLLYSQAETPSPAIKIVSLNQLLEEWDESKQQVIELYPPGQELEAFVYVDTETAIPSSIFIFQELYSAHDEVIGSLAIKNFRLFVIINQFVKQSHLLGMVQLKLLLHQENYYILQVKPYFDSCLDHLHVLDLNYPALMLQNMSKQANLPNIGDYPDQHRLIYTNKLALLPYQTHSHPSKEPHIPLNK